MLRTITENRGEGYTIREHRSKAPNSKHDIIALADVSTYLFYNKILTEWKKPLKNLHYADMTAERLQELFDYANITSQTAARSGSTATLPSCYEARCARFTRISS